MPQARGLVYDAPMKKSLPLLAAAALACETTSQPDAIVDAADPTDEPVFDNVQLPFPGEAPNFHDAFVRGPDDVWLAGDHGQVWHYDGVNWSSLDAGVDVTLRGIDGEGAVPADAPPETPPAKLWVVGEGGTIVRFDGEVPTPEPWPVPPEGELALPLVDLNDVQYAGGAVVAVGNQGLVLRRAIDPATELPLWAQERADTVENLQSLSLHSGGDRGTAVGALGTIVRLDGERWRRFRVDGLTVPLHTIWCEDADRCWMGGLDGTILRVEGDTVTRIPGAPQVFLRSAFGFHMNDVWFVGWGGTIVRSDGTTATAMGEFTDRRLETIVGWFTPSKSGVEDAPDVPRLLAAGVSGAVLLGP